jgi:hypothetical protein
MDKKQVYYQLTYRLERIIADIEEVQMRIQNEGLDTNRFNRLSLANKILSDVIRDLIEREKDIL